MTKTFKSNEPSVNKHFHQFNIKREPTLNIERSNSCMKCDGKFSKGHLAVCLAKNTTCKSCNNRNFTRGLCNTHRKIVNIDVQTVYNTYCNYPSEQPVVNNERLNREYCGVINAWSESGEIDYDDYSVLNETTSYVNEGKEQDITQKRARKIKPSDPYYTGQLRQPCEFPQEKLT